MVGTDIPSRCAFLEVLSGNGPKYDFDDIDCYAPPCMCFHIDIEDHVNDAPELQVDYLREKAAHLQAWQVDLEATEAEPERQRQELARQQAAHPPIDDDGARTGAPSMLRFPRTAYNMAAAACRLEDI